MPQPLVLTYDLGTQSARAMLVDPAGTIVAKVQKKYEIPYRSEHPGWAEQSADFYWDCLCEVSLALKAENAALWGDIIAVTVTTVRDSCLCIDREGKPLRDVILWLDKREAPCREPIPYANSLLFRLVQMSAAVELQRKVSACNWIKENQPELWAKTDKFIFLSAYLTYRLCGALKDCTANIIGHVPFDNKRRAWMKDNDLKRCIFDVETEKLCTLVEPGETMGPITPYAGEATGAPVGLPLIATGSDKGCETLGLSCISPEKAAISFGTTATIQLTTDRYVEPQPFIPPYPAVVPGLYNPEIQIYRGYWLISWFKKEFAAKEVADAQRLGVAPEDLLNKRLKEIPPGCEGLVMQPYFTPGVAMPFAKGAIIGFSDVHTRIHIYRAIIEGINFSLMEGLRLLEKRVGSEITELYLAGGGSQSDEICQITADMFGLPVHRVQTHEVSGIGSSMVAFVAKGLFPDYPAAVASMVHIRDTFRPDAAVHAAYEAIYSEVFTKIFGRLQSLYRKNK